MEASTFIIRLFDGTIRRVTATRDEAIACARDMLKPYMDREDGTRAYAMDGNGAIVHIVTDGECSDWHATVRLA